MTTTQIFFAIDRYNKKQYKSASYYFWGFGYIDEENIAIGRYQLGNKIRRGFYIDIYTSIRIDDNVRKVLFS